MPASDALTALAVVGGRVATGLRDVTTDLAALDSRGWWVVVRSFEGDAVCARFSEVRPHLDPPPACRPWRGPARHAWSSSLDRDQFCARVDAIRAEIAAGMVYQVNLCRILSAPVNDSADVLALGTALAAANPAPHAAVIQLPRQGLHIASASPELFLGRDGERVWSRPIKGTAAPRQPFLPKDRAENVMIVDLVRNDLGRVTEVGSVHVPALCVREHHPGLDHLVSTVAGRLRPEAGWSELLEASFPPGSVSGAPKLTALEVIRRLEPVPRGPYCGAIGWVDADTRRGELNVGIRTFWLEGGAVRFGTGAGITWDSRPEDEWDETELKANRLLSIASGDLAPGT